jgi:putative addiction module component (TIGR02574 family)
MRDHNTDFNLLSIAERIQLVEDIWDSIAAETSESLAITPAQRAEIQRRLAEHDAEPSSAVPWDSVRSELLQRRS